MWAFYYGSLLGKLNQNDLRHFATTELSPWAIAWLVKTDDWEHLERIIQRNCRLLGGYHNVVIPVSDDGTLSPTFEPFLFFFDPDYIIPMADCTLARQRATTSSRTSSSILMRVWSPNWALMGLFLPLQSSAGNLERREGSKH
jgi:hypothetical protein